MLKSGDAHKRGCGGRHGHERASRGAWSEGVSGGHGASAGCFSCKSEVIRNYLSDPTGFRRVRQREARKSVLRSFSTSAYRQRGVQVDDLLWRCLCGPRWCVDAVVPEELDRLGRWHNF